MVTEGPGSLVEFSRDAKEVSPSLVWFIVVLRVLPQGSGVGSATEGHGKIKEQGLRGLLAR